MVFYGGRGTQVYNVYTKYRPNPGKDSPFCGKHTPNRNLAQFYHQISSPHRFLSKSNHYYRLILKGKSDKQPFFSWKLIVFNTKRQFMSILKKKKKKKSPFMWTCMCTHCKLEYPPPPRVFLYTNRRLTRTLYFSRIITISACVIKKIPQWKLSLAANCDTITISQRKTVRPLERKYHRHTMII